MTTPRLTRCDRLRLEYDTPRAGDFGQGALEDAAAVEARIGEAAHHVPLDRLAVSPQCGFASGEAGRFTNTGATLTPTLSLAEGEGAVSIPSPPEGERVRVRGRAGRGTHIRE